GTWQVAQAVVTSVSDGSFSGSSYHGFFGDDGSTTVMVDDWLLENACGYPVQDGFDGVPTGGQPSCFTLDSPLTTSGGSPLVFPLSLPNVLVLGAAGDANDRFAMWDTADDNGGDTLTQVSFNADFTGGPQAVGVLGRGDASSSPATYY